MKKILIITTLIALTYSCKKEKDDPVAPKATTGDLALSTQFVVNGSPYHADSVYVDDFSHNYKISFTNVYLSQLKFEGDDGAETSFTTSHVLLKPETGTYSLGKIKAGHYHELKFNIGIDSVTNHSDPNSYPATSPLYPQSPSMHWTWNSGYIFYKIEGSVDTDSDGSFETSFRFHIGTDGLLRKGSYVIHSDMKAGVTNTVSMKVDLGKFLKGINLSVDNSTHTMNDLPLATRVANNSTTAITN